MCRSKLFILRGRQHPPLLITYFRYHALIQQEPTGLGRYLLPRFGLCLQTRKMKLAETCRGGVNFV